MHRRHIALLLFKLLTNVACVAVDERTELDTDDELGLDTEGVEDPEDPEPEEPEPPSPAVGNAEDLHAQVPEGCAELEQIVDEALTELRTCTSDAECTIHVGSDRCGCDLAALPIPLDPLLETFYGLLDTAGCPASCPGECVGASEAACVAGLCEIVG